MFNLCSSTLKNLNTRGVLRIIFVVKITKPLRLWVGQLAADSCDLTKFYQTDFFKWGARCEMMIFCPHHDIMQDDCHSPALRVCSQVLAAGACTLHTAHVSINTFCTPPFPSQTQKNVITEKIPRTSAFHVVTDHFVAEKRNKVMNFKTEWRNLSHNFNFCIFVLLLK